MPLERHTTDFDEFYLATSRRVLLHMYVLTGDRIEAQDLTQEAFVRAWQRWSTITAYENPEAWVRMVAERLALPAAQVAAVRARLGTLPFVTGVDFESREQAFTRFKILTSAAPELVAATHVENLPESLGVSTSSKDDYASVSEATASMPGVAEVNPGEILGSSAGNTL